MPTVESIRNVALAVLIGASIGLAVVFFVGCTAAERQSALNSSTQAAITSAKIAACVQGVMAEEQLEALRARREAEAEQAIEADRLKSEMHAPSSVSQEVDKLVRGDAGVM